MSFYCDNLWLNLLIFLAGTWALIKGSDLFVDSAAGIARLWKVPELVIGLTLVSIGTSLPELSSSLYASWKNVGDFTVGNVVGSNVCNIALILGLGIIGAKELTFSPAILRRDMPIMIGVYLLTILMFWFNWMLGPDGTAIHGLSAWCGIILLICGCLYTWRLFRSPSQPQDASKATSHSLLYLVLFLILGLLMITGGSKAMVETVVWGANRLKIPTLIISSTIVAFGTSVPELAVTLAGVIKKQHDIAIGNIVGSNIFNILLIFGTCALVNPLPLTCEGGVGLFNIAAMLLVALVLWGFMAIKKTSLVWWQGIIFLLLYALFLAFNCKDVIRHFL